MLITVVLVLVMALGAVNYYLEKDKPIGISDDELTMSETKSEQETSEEVVEASNSNVEILKDNQTDDTSEAFFSGKNNYFLDYRFERDETRADEINTINELINATETSKEIKEKAQNRIFEIADNMEKELHIEGLIKAKGFEDAVVMIGEETVSVVVKHKNLSEEEATMILDILTKETKREPECMSIIPQG